MLGFLIYRTDYRMTLNPNILFYKMSIGNLI